MAFEYKEHFSYLTNICLNLTDACNFACRYCFVEQNPHYMTYEVALKAVDFILDNLEKKRKYLNDPKIKGSITYFGGEPTLMWDSIIVPLTKHIKENKLPIHLNMTTNASLLNEERIQFLKDNNIAILLSMDGDKATQCFNRPARDPNINSFDVVEKNIPAILKAFPQTTYRATIYAPTVHHTFDNYLYAIQQGFKNIYFLPDSRHAWTEDEKKTLKLELDKIFSFYSYCFSKNILPPINFRLINRGYENIIKHDLKIKMNTLGDLEKPHPIMRCGLGTTLGSIGYDGNIYGCQEQTSKNIESHFYIGNIFNGGINKDLHEKLLKSFYQPTIQTCENKKLCEACPLRQICHDFCCPSTSWDMFNNYFIDSEIHCLWTRWIFDNARYMMKKMVEAGNEAFRFYLYETCRYKDNFKKEGEECNV